jgi:heptosyltransferase III
VNLLIVRPGAIGDTLLTFPVLKALREYYPNPHITFVSNANVLPLAIAFGLAEAVSDYGHVQWGELFSTTGIQTPAMREQLQDIDLAICWLRDTDGLLEGNLRTAGVRRVIVAPGRLAEGMHIHVVQYLAQTIGISVGVKRGKEWDGFSSGRMESLRNAPIAIHPGSGGAQKCWPTRRFATVIKWLWSLNGLRGDSHSVLLLAGSADQERLHDILDSIGHPPEPDMLKVLLNAPLLEVAQQLQQCKCYLGNDSGITHLAAMLGVPTVALFGPSDPATWHPVGPSVRVIRAQALEHLGSDVVIEALESFLSIQSL